MLVLEATSDHQGDRDDDYHWCTDGELVYRQEDMGCRTPDCGCERGWAGFDSHRSTTTVKVVERVGFTVSDLARELATSLSDGGWLTEPDPSNQMVAEIVDEIIECANHFREGATLGRSGDLVWRRVLPSAQEFEITDDDLAHLADNVTDKHPFKVLERAAFYITDYGANESLLRQRLRAIGWFEESVLSKALDWLATGQPPYSLLDPDTPKWLHNLDAGTIRAARYRDEGEMTSYLLEVKLPGGPVGTLQLTIDAGGRLGDAFAWGGPISKLIRQKRSHDIDDFGTFRPLSTKMAQRALRAARDAFDATPIEERPFSPWPSSRPLVDFVLDHLVAT